MAPVWPLFDIPRWLWTFMFDKVHQNLSWKQANFLEWYQLRILIIGEWYKQEGLFFIVCFLVTVTKYWAFCRKKGLSEIIRSLKCIKEDPVVFVCCVIFGAFLCTGTNLKRITRWLLHFVCRRVFIRLGLSFRSAVRICGACCTVTGGNRRCTLRLVDCP